KDLPRAESEARIAATDQYNRTPAQVLLAQAMAQQERAAEALSLAAEIERDAQERHEGAVESLELVRGDALARMQRYDEAVAAFQHEIATFPRNRQAYASLYIVYMLMGKPAEAHATLEALVKASPNQRTRAFAASTADVVGDHDAAAVWRRRAQRK
ncbi:MAG: tetratricopeptide repeat protein, partial [Acidobacteriota bacterium]